MTGVCRNCGDVGIRFDNRGTAICKGAQRDRKRRAYAEKKKYSRGNEKSGYGHGLTRAQVWAFREGKVCALCGSGEHICVDHNHQTGKIRGALCMKCNLALGRIEAEGWREWFARAEIYLLNHS